ncbi:hypothetical protein QUF54_04230, partial [Candidatus Marithioploca araucensis]|nr:hypothetical protein [Candidatus Marithioploca araucensis]
HFGFKVESILCSGYYPLPNWFAKIDPRHGHFITIKARKIAKEVQIVFLYPESFLLHLLI